MKMHNMDKLDLPIINSAYEKNWSTINAPPKMAFFSFYFFNTNIQNSLQNLVHYRIIGCQTM